MGKRSVHTLDKRKANYHLHSSLPFLEKWPQEPETGKTCRNGTRISVWKFWPGKQTPFLLIFHRIDPKSHVPFTLQPDYFLNAKPPGRLFCETASLRAVRVLRIPGRFSISPPRHGMIAKVARNFLDDTNPSTLFFLVLCGIVVNSEAGRSTYPSDQNLLYQ